MCGSCDVCTAAHGAGPPFTPLSNLALRLLTEPPHSQDASLGKSAARSQRVERVIGGGGEENEGLLDYLGAQNWVRERIKNTFIMLLYCQQLAPVSH